MKTENRKIAILGSTGSIGRQTLDIARRYSLAVEALAANSDVKTLEKQIREFSPKYVSLVDEKAASELSAMVADTPTKVFAGKDGSCEMITYLECDTVLNSIVGTAGLLPTLTAVDCKKNIALANKETLVTAGELVMSKIRENGVSILPVDSEHCAVHQCLRAGKKDEVAKLILTASGGPFFGRSREELSEVTVSDALNHPTWSMGKKITIDSATLMNKGFEVIEAAHLFGMSASDIDVVVHRESIVHSMVAYKDGSVIAQMGVPDMRTCISYALFDTKHMENVSEIPDFSKIAKLTFASPDEKTFTLLPLARYAFDAGGTLAAMLNAANDMAVSLFLENKIKFTDIMDLVSETVHKYSKSKDKLSYHGKLPTVEDITESACEAEEYLLTLAQVK
ncbi:MAG: 1-deoxy-D-xylulose-5-phosphate reductoisomerase [Ruminococcaceae bacterium]|nr:1-deoxy-D-xylulose-5-phosphate reductoisomerase [Oscillospiraceae bacterium]